MYRSFVSILIVWTWALNTTFAQQAEIPVLCYHQVREWQSGDSKNAKTYIIPPQRFREHMKVLHDSGYRTILPEEHLRYLKEGKSISPKVVILTFDDGTMSQYTYALPELDKYGFKAVFSIMTVTLDKPGYMSRKQVKEISDRGHVIANHTWDHHNVTKYEPDDWAIQLTGPTRELEKITGNPVHYFIYPFGAWDTTAIRKLKGCGYNGAYQLGGKCDDTDREYTMRRMIATGYMDGRQLILLMKNAFR